MHLSPCQILSTPNIFKPASYTILNFQKYLLFRNKNQKLEIIHYGKTDMEKNYCFLKIKIQNKNLILKKQLWNIKNVFQKKKIQNIFQKKIRIYFYSYHYFI